MKQLMLFLLMPAMACASGSTHIVTATLPNGVIDTAYSAAVAGSGGCTPYTWSVSSGTLPAGLTATPILNTTSYNISGTPTVAAAYAFTIQVKGCGGHLDRKTYTVTIQQPLSHSVALKWNASTSPNIRCYNVLRSTGGGSFAIIASPATTNYVDDWVTAGVTYSYAATAIDTSNLESVYSNQVTVTIP